MRAGFAGFASLAVLVSAAGACSNDDNCGQIQCINNVSMYLRVALPAAEMRGSTIRVCRNAVCSEGKVDLLPAFHGDSQGVALGGGVPGDVTLDVPTTGGTYIVVATIPIDDAVIDPARDQYELRVIRDGREVKGLSERPKYQESNPSGDNCPSVCVNATIGTP